MKIEATAEQVAEARGWIADCQWREDLDYGVSPAEHASDAEIVRNVQRHYDGGWEAFLANSGFPAAEAER